MRSINSIIAMPLNLLNVEDSCMDYLIPLLERVERVERCKTAEDVGNVERS